MAQQLKLTQIGNSIGVILPKELLARLRSGKGDLLSVVETPGGIELRPHDPVFEQQMKIARDVMHRHRDALRELAK
jgi:putative addiction module antidote